MDGFFACFRFARGYEDFGAARLKEAKTLLIPLMHTYHLGLAYPDAACNPRPLDPPVTTATLPSNEKMLLKSLSLTSASADIMKVLRELKRMRCNGRVERKEQFLMSDLPITKDFDDATASCLGSRFVDRLEVCSHSTLLHPFNTFYFYSIMTQSCFAL